MMMIEPEWFRWSVGTLIGVAGIAATLRTQVGSRERRISRHAIDVDAGNEAVDGDEAAPVRLIVSTHDTLAARDEIVRRAWFCIAQSRTHDGRAVFRPPQWRELTKDIAIQNGDTIWIRAAYINVSSQVQHDIVVGVHELSVLRGIRGRVTIVRHSPNVSQGGQTRRLLEYDHPTKIILWLRNTFKGTKVPYLNRYEQVVVDCVAEVRVTRNGRWRVKPCSDQYLLSPPAPVPVELKNGVCTLPHAGW
jgi:hypothetical protein